MNLYYDKDKHLFGTEITKTNECKFMSYEGVAEHIGWKEKYNKTCISEGNIKIIIHTNFYPERVIREWFRAYIYVNDVLLRPLSQCYNLGKVSKPGITIEMTHEDFDWGTFLEEICDICNHSDAWLNNELEKLLAKLPQDTSNFVEQIGVLKQLREYDSMNHYYVEKYRSHFDPILFNIENVKPQLDCVFNEGEPSSVEMFDVIWNYIKNYYHNIPMPNA